MNQHRFWGYVISDENSGVDASSGIEEYTFKFEFVNSLAYVAIIGMAYLVLFNGYWKLKLILDNLWERQNSVIAIKTFEIKSLFDSESEEETPEGITIGTYN